MFIRRISLAAAAALSVSLLSGCGGGNSNGAPGNSIGTGKYVVVAWNDLGMHCLSPSYDTAVILPPYNTVWAQVIMRGNPPQVVTAGLTAEYRIVNNTTSQNKGLFYQFWTNALKLFGGAPTMDKGLNLVDSAISNSLSGTMVAKVDHFQVNGIPVVPIEDNGVKNPYQVAEITVRDTSGAVVAQTRATVPTSDEINCGKCHIGATVTDVFNDVLTKHDKNFGTRYATPLMLQKPVLCASCHGSPALLAAGVAPTAGSSGKYLSQALHGSHAARGAACYDCHPGATTKCNRSAKHTAADGNCMACHGDMVNIAATIASGSRIPWVSEPKCVTCHSGVAQVDTGITLYRNAATGHGGVYCTGCHGSPHAMFPSNQESDNYQARQYQQGVAKSIGDCGVCHDTSRGGGGAADFASVHGGSKISACNVCHTGFQNAANTANWPHQFQWKSR